MFEGKKITKKYCFAPQRFCFVSKQIKIIADIYKYAFTMQINNMAWAMKIQLNTHAKKCIRHELGDIEKSQSLAKMQVDLRTFFF